MERELSLYAVSNEISYHNRILLMSLYPFILFILTKDAKEHLGGPFFLKLIEILRYVVPGITVSQIVIILKLLRIEYQLKRDKTSYVDGSFEEFSHNVPVFNVFSLKPIKVIGRKGERTF